MTRQELKTVERAYEAQGIDLQEEGATEEEINALMTVVPDATGEQQGTAGGAGILISEDLFAPMIELIHEVAPKLAVPFLLHCHVETEELFLAPLLHRYIVQQGKKRGMSIEFTVELINAMPEEYMDKMEDVLLQNN